MPRTIRFHLDENCAKAIAQGVTRRGIDFTTTPEAGLTRAIDEQQVAYCLTNVAHSSLKTRTFSVSTPQASSTRGSPSAPRIRNRSARSSSASS